MGPEQVPVNGAVVTVGPGNVVGTTPPRVVVVGLVVVGPRWWPGLWCASAGLLVTSPTTTMGTASSHHRDLLSALLLPLDREDELVGGREGVGAVHEREPVGRARRHLPLLQQLHRQVDA